jgi:hypothetical protein
MYIRTRPSKLRTDAITMSRLPTLESEAVIESIIAL